LLLGGSDEERISTKSIWKAGVPICGVVSEVAPAGAQSVKLDEQVSPASPWEEKKKAVAARSAKRRR
jgi:hypothetical protein